MAYTSFIVTKNFKNKLTSFRFFVYPCARFLIWLKQAFSSSFQPFRYVPMIKQALKKHGTNEKHAIDAKKIVFLKDNFI